MTFYEEVDALDKILKHEVPTRADLDKIDSIRKDSALVRYFFEKLSSPSWVKPLREKGVFDHSEIVRQDGEYLIAQTWPESQYLARVAKQAAQDAIEIVLDVETDNPRVIQDFLDVLCEINADLAVRAVPGKIKKWIESPYLSSNICKKFGKFATALIRANKIQKALKIIDVVLKMKPQQVDREKTKKGLETWDFSRIPEAEGRFKTNRLDEFAKEIETDILKTAPQKVGELYVEKLTNALRFDKHAYGLPVNEISDLSYIWRPTIGSSKGGYGPDKYKDMFIDGICRVGKHLADAAPEKVQPFCENLIGLGYPVFIRLAIHIALLAPDNCKDFIEKIAEDIENIRRFDIAPEYRRLLKEQFPNLPATTRKTIIDAIENGPDIEQLKRSMTESSGREPSEEQMEEQVKIWKLSRLKPVSQYIEGSLKEFFEKESKGYYLEEELPLSESRWGEIAPEEIDFNKLNAEQTIEAVKGWSEPERETFSSPTKEGLACKLSGQVTERADAFSGVAEKAQDLQPIYLSYYLSGLSDAARKENAIDWAPVLTLCEERLSHYGPGYQSTQNSVPGHSYGARQIKTSIAHLIRTGLENQVNNIQLNHKDGLWRVILMLIRDENPTPDDENNRESDKIEPVIISINSVRGIGAHAVVDFARWLRRHKEGTELPDEVETVLESLLDPEKEPTLAIRSVFGQHFLQLFLLDQEWLKSNIQRIFPLETDQESVNLRRAAWVAYISSCTAYTNIFDLLKSTYEKAVDETGHTSPVKPIVFFDEAEGLYQHLLRLFIHGHIPGLGEEGLLRKFIDKASGKVLAKGVWYLWKVFEVLKKSPNAEVVRRLLDFWDARLQSIESAQNPEDYLDEIKNFAMWGDTSPFEPSDFLKNMTRTVALAKGDIHAGEILQQAVKYSIYYPKETVDLLKALVSGDRLPWDLSLRTDLAGKIIEEAKSSDNTEAREIATDVINTLGEKGIHKFRHLL